MFCATVNHFKISSILRCTFTCTTFSSHLIHSIIMHIRFPYLPHLPYPIFFLLCFTVIPSFVLYTSHLLIVANICLVTLSINEVAPSASSLTRCSVSKIRSTHSILNWSLANGLPVNPFIEPLPISMLLVNPIPVNPCAAESFPVNPIPVNPIPVNPCPVKPIKSLLICFLLIRSLLIHSLLIRSLLIRSLLIRSLLIRSLLTT